VCVCATGTRRCRSRRSTCGRRSSRLTTTRCRTWAPGDAAGGRCSISTSKVKKYSALCLVMLISSWSFRRTLKGDCFGFFTFIYVIQHSFICRPSDSTVSDDAGIEPRTVATLALTVRRSNHLARSHPHLARSHPRLAGSHPHLAVSHPPYSAMPAQRISHTGPPGYIGWTR
jgi:hypothetical protein